MLDAIGVVAFGLSGYLVARRRCLDIYGTVVLALVTALGGGTIRDVVLGIFPPVNLVSPVLIALAAGPALILSIRPIDRLLRNGPGGPRLPIGTALLLADAVGLAAFTASGVAAALAASDSITLALFCGVLTATGGGMMRDLLAGVVPAVLRREIYAVASLVGAATMVTLDALAATPTAAVAAGMAATFIVRVGTYALGVHLPVPDGCADKDDE